MTQESLSVTLRDYNGEKSSFSLPINGLTAVNSALVWDSVDQIQNSVATLSNANIVGVNFINPRSTGLDIDAADDTSQVERGLRVFLLDTTLNIHFYFTLPSPKFGYRDVNSDTVLISGPNVHPDIQAFKDTIELFGRSRFGNSVVVTGMEYVGRSRSG
jgi:hypothetical protein